MFSHLTLPYRWVNCMNPENCSEIVHLQDTAETLNIYPTKWVKEMLPEGIIDDDGTITIRNQQGQKHNSNGPAYVNTDGHTEWHLNGELHREDGPAVIYPNGTGEWYFNGEYHREDGPAVINFDGSQYWYMHGKRHRLNGPAVTKPDGLHEWWFNGKKQAVPNNK